MSQPIQTVVGIDVGGETKGFHAVALLGSIFVAKTKATDPSVILAWCLEQKATIVAVDAPCGWSQDGLSRQAERELVLLDEQIYCFSTPIREHAGNNKKGFYDWVFNGEKLYMELQKYFQLFNGDRRSGSACIETFPQAVVCALEGRLVSAKAKVKVRRETLTNRGYNISNLSNIDFIDAALCAVAADEFRKGNYKMYGNCDEGFIVVPAPRKR